MQLLAGIDAGMKLMEIGPSYNPLIPRSQGWNTVVVDHASQDDLRAKYSDDPAVEVSRIEEVDVVWSQGALAGAVPAIHHGTIDAIVASHVIEHVPNFVAFLASFERLLTPEGFVVLAVPDMRTCFDILRSPTTTGAVLEAHILKAERHSPRALFDHSAYASLRSGKSTWFLESDGEASYIEGFEAAATVFRTLRPGEIGDYVDCHAWQFTPASFALIMLELAALGLTELAIASEHPTMGCEFFVTLRRLEGDQLEAEALDRLRLETHLRARAELGRSWVALGEELR